MGHITTTAEDKIARDSGGHCWDYAHVAVRLAADLGIPLKRKTKGIHMFVAYRLPEYKNKKIYFAVDPLYCSSPFNCAYEFLDKKFNVMDKASKEKFFERSIKSETCFQNSMKRDPNLLLFYK